MLQQGKALLRDLKIYSQNSTPKPLNTYLGYFLSWDSSNSMKQRCHADCLVEKWLSQSWYTLSSISVLENQVETQKERGRAPNHHLWSPPSASLQVSSSCLCIAESLVYSSCDLFEDECCEYTQMRLKCLPGEHFERMKVKEVGFA